MDPVAKPPFLSGDQAATGFNQIFQKGRSTDLLDLSWPCYFKKSHRFFFSFFHVLVVSQVVVSFGRHFQDFAEGDAGIVIGSDAEAQSCQVGDRR